MQDLIHLRHCYLHFYMKADALTPEVNALVSSQLDKDGGARAGVLTLGRKKHLHAYCCSASDRQKLHTVTSGVLIPPAEHLTDWNSISNPFFKFLEYFFFTLHTELKDTYLISSCIFNSKGCCVLPSQVIMRSYSRVLKRTEAMAPPGM